MENNPLKQVLLSFEIALSESDEERFKGRIQLLPYGRFYPQDGRESGKNGWLLDESNGLTLQDQINNSKTKLINK